MGPLQLEEDTTTEAHSAADEAWHPSVIDIEGELTGNNTTRLYLCSICIAVG